MNLKTASSSPKSAPKSLPPRPKRPLTGYNRFFREERLRLKKLQAAEAKNKRGTKSQAFLTMGKEVSKRWVSLPAEEKKKFTDAYELDLVQYRKEVAEYNELKLALQMAEEDKMTKDNSQETLPREPQGTETRLTLNADKNTPPSIHNHLSTPTTTPRSPPDIFAPKHPTQQATIATELMLNEMRIHRNLQLQASEQRLRAELSLPQQTLPLGRTATALDHLRLLSRNLSASPVALPMGSGRSQLLSTLRLTQHHHGMVQQPTCFGRPVERTNAALFLRGSVGSLLSHQSDLTRRAQLHAALGLPIPEGLVAGTAPLPPMDLHLSDRLTQLGINL